MNTKPIHSAIVLGGGLAGIAASIRLAQAGVKVTLLETSRRLGGRASSHLDPATGEMLDNCQHVLLGCCTNLIDLYRRLGVADQIEWVGDLHFFDKLGHHDVMQASDLPAPLHLSLAMLKFKTLSLVEKIAISRAMLAMMRLGAAGRDAAANITFRAWLDRQNQPEGAINKFWAVVIVSALNQHPNQASAAPAIQVFQDGFLSHAGAYRMGVASVPLRRLYDPAESVIAAAGGIVMMGSSVERIMFDGRRITSVIAERQTLTADLYINAMPFDRLDKVIDDPLREADIRLANLDKFHHSPILGIHLWFDRPVLEIAHMIFVDSPLQWAFRKNAGEEGEHMHCVISAADDWIDHSQDAIIDMAVRELTAYLPALQTGAKLVRSRVIKEKRATFSVEPGVDRWRPEAAGAVSNLILAGDWAKTGWPATMEGAVRSGYIAAGAALADKHPLVADLPAAELYRWISR